MDQSLLQAFSIMQLVTAAMHQGCDMDDATGACRWPVSCCGRCMSTWRRTSPHRRSSIQSGLQARTTGSQLNLAPSAQRHGGMMQYHVRHLRPSQLSGSARPMKLPAKIGETNFRFTIVSVSLGVAGVVTLGVGLVRALQGDATSAVALLGAGLVLLMASIIDRFDSPKGLGMEAKLRELDQTIGQAEIVLKQLRGVTELTGKGLLDLYLQTGHVNNVTTTADLLGLMQRIKASLVDVGSSPEKIRHVLEPSAERIVGLLAMVLLQPVFDELNQEIHKNEYRPDLAEDDIQREELRERAAYLRSEHDRLTAHWKEPPSKWSKRIHDTLGSGCFAELPTARQAKKEWESFAPEIAELFTEFTISTPARWLALVGPKGG